MPQPVAEDLVVDPKTKGIAHVVLFVRGKGWVVVRPNPYAAVTQPDGSFEIPGVPAGEIELQLWHEKAGRLAGAPTTLGKADDKGRLTVEVKAAGTDLGVITIDADAFRR